jgi:hypothetical protein
MGRKLRRNVALGAVVALGALGVAAGMPTPAAAAPGPHPLEQTRGLIQALGLAPLLCAGTPLAPTLQCAIYNPATETYFNPYTADGSSPGILGLDSFLGLL